MFPVLVAVNLNLVLQSDAFVSRMFFFYSAGMACISQFSTADIDFSDGLHDMLELQDGKHLISVIVLTSSCHLVANVNSFICQTSQ